MVQQPLVGLVLRMFDFSADQLLDMLAGFKEPDPVHCRILAFKLVGLLVTAIVVTTS